MGHAHECGVTASRYKCSSRPPVCREIRVEIRSDLGGLYLPKAYFQMGPVA